jgi:hypothetical protein
MHRPLEIVPIAAIARELHNKLAQLIADYHLDSVWYPFRDSSGACALLAPIKINGERLRARHVHFSVTDTSVCVLLCNCMATLTLMPARLG